MADLPGGTERDRVIAAALPPALELMTAFTQSAREPDLFWQAMSRVMTDTAARTDPAQAVAEVVFGVSALSGILLDQLAAATGEDPAAVLAWLHRQYVAA